jgi:hypothetical protein
MEAELSDLKDRNLISMFGKEQPLKLDQNCLCS